jgi:hypothetical protein
MTGYLIFYFIPVYDTGVTNRDAIIFFISWKDRGPVVEFVLVLYYDAISYLHYIGLNDKMTGNELEGIWPEALAVWSRYYTSMWLEGMAKFP